jgi:hypothetical protein
MNQLQDRWRLLLALASDVKALAPWSFMVETDNFAIPLPAPHTVGLVSVMGARGEHFAVALYLGYRAIVEFWALAADEGREEPEAILEIDHLQLSWEDRRDLDRRDRQMLADLGVKPRGPHSWPMLRRYRAGYYPWFAADDEVVPMIAALEQLLAMAPRLRSDCAILAPPAGRHYMLRYPPSPSAAPTEWCERFDTLPISDEVRISAVIDAERITQVESLPRLAMEMELDLFAAPMMRIDGKREGIGQPYYPYMLLGVERGRGMIVGFKLLTALHGLEPMWSEIPAAFADLLIGAAARPQRIFVHRPLLAKLLARLCEHQGIEIQLVRKLKNLAAVRRSLNEMAAR